MARDWSRNDWCDEVAVDPRLARIVQARSVIADPLDSRVVVVGGRTALIQLGHAGKYMLVGLMATALYVWPATFLAHIFSGIRVGLVWTILAASVVLVSLGTWLITRFESRFWSRRLDDLPEWADPPTWR